MAFEVAITIRLGARYMYTPLRRLHVCAGLAWPWKKQI